MAESPSLEGFPASSTVLEPTSKTHACVLCQKRKVRCDRKDPCSGCVKAQVECVFRDPLPPRRRKKKPETMILARLKRYEEVLKKSGIDPNAIDGNTGSSRTDPVRSDHRVARQDVMPNDTAVPVPNLFEHNTARMGPGRLILREGRSIYLDNNLWRTISNELQDAEDILPGSSEDASDHSLHDRIEGIDLDENFLVFGSASKRSLADLHPSPVHIFKLWQVFLESVHPLTKIIHAPTVQQRILDATSDLSSVPRELETLMFAIYCSALTALGDEEVQEIFGESRATLLVKCRQGAQQALINAGILKTSDIVVLQAFLIFILSVRLVYDPHSLWPLTGIAVRVAQRAGLHRDGSQLGLSVFETEMRRRLWWQITVVDATVGHMSGCNSSLFPIADTNSPLNINDSDLYPDMKEKVVEHPGPTEMIFCLMRYELGKWLYRQSKSRSVTFDGYWRTISGDTISLQEKDHSIEELENALEEKFIQHCDSSIPLHLVTLIVGRSAVAMIRLMAHHPRNYHERGEHMPQSEKDRLFDICLDIAEYGNILLATDKTKRYLWHVDYHFPWDSLIYMLSELRYRTVGDGTVKAWHFIDITCTRQYQQLGPRARSPLHLAIANLAVKAWTAHVTECERRHMAPLPQPKIVSLFSKLIPRTRSASQMVPAPDRPKAASMSFATGDGGNNPPPPPPPPTYDDPLRNVFGQQANSELNDFTPDAIDDSLAGMYAVDDSPMDWGQWDELLQQFQQQVDNGEVFT